MSGAATKKTATVSVIPLETKGTQTEDEWSIQDGETAARFRQRTTEDVERLLARTKDDQFLRANILWVVLNFFPEIRDAWSEELELFGVEVDLKVKDLESESESEGWETAEEAEPEQEQEEEPEAEPQAEVDGA